MTKRDTQRDVFKTLVNKQLEPFGVSYDDVLNQPDWYMQYQTTPEKEQDFIKWGTELIRKELKLNKKMAEMEMSWFILQWGLTTGGSYNETELEGAKIEIEVPKKKTSK